MAHFIFLTEDQVNDIKTLFKNRFNNEYIVLNEGNGFSDIAQFSEKYDNVRLVTVRNDKLSKADKLR